MREDTASTRGSPALPAESVPVGVIGGGQMGSGIAHAFLLAGAHVSLIETTEELAASAAARVRGLVSKTEERGTLAEPSSAVLGRFAAYSDFATLAGAALVVEAVPEIVSLKVEVLGSLEAVVGDEALIATNTSSISIDELAALLARPERFFGMHFFNPVPASASWRLCVAQRRAPTVSAWHATG